MVKFVNEEKRCIAEGEQVFINQTSQHLSVMTGIAFNKDGDYSISVHEGRTIVTEELARHGKWIRDAESDCGISCPFCGIPASDFCYSRDYIDLEYEPNYCPNCGAKMDDKHGKPCDDCQEFDCYGCKYAERKEE